MKRIYLIMIILIILSFSCLTIKEGSTEISKDYFNKTYAKSSIKFIKMTNSMFKNFKYIFRRAVLENKDLNDDQKETLLSKLENLNFTENKFFEFYIWSNEPLLNKNLNLKFQLIDNKGNDLLENTLYFTYKNIMVMDNMTFISYPNIWMITAKNPIDEKNIDKNNFPIKFIVTYPNEKDFEYLIE